MRNHPQSNSSRSVKCIPKRLFAVLAAVLIVLAGLLAVVVYVYYNEPAKPVVQSETKTVDNRISPYIGQQLDVELHRIRNRALYDLMLKRGNAWKATPQFYWIIKVDDKEANSLGTVGYGSTGMFVTWDTIGMDNRIPFRVVNETPTSTVTIRIMERQTSGLLGRRYADVQMEVINLTYDYRTGRWAGDDFFKDPDGYGHFLGKNYEVWFDLYQSDYDHDGIPYWTEVNVLGTDPTVDDSTHDPDGDGIPTSWEWYWGFNPFVADNFTTLDPDFDGLSVLDEYQLRNYQADPFYPEMYFEVDNMQKRGPFDLPHVFYKESQEMLCEIYARHSISVWIDDGWADTPVNGGGEFLPFIKAFEDVNGGQMLGFYNHNFPQERHGLFRYIVIGNSQTWSSPSHFNYYDSICIGTGLNAMYVKRAAFTPRFQRVCIAKGLLHEIGHTLGLLPYTFPGNDILGPASVRYPSMPADVYNNYLNNYHSIMNYKYIWTDKTLVDYSHGDNGAPYDQNDWDHIYIPTFNRDARAVEETADKSFEDYEVVSETAYPVVDGWVNASMNLTKSLPSSMTFKVYNNMGSTLHVLVNPHPLSNSSWNVRVYAHPDINPFPVINSWTLVAEGRVNAIGKLSIYTDGQNLI